jgi:hypothetical protein
MLCNLFKLNCCCAGDISAVNQQEEVNTDNISQFSGMFVWFALLSQSRILESSVFLHILGLG